MCILTDMKFFVVGLGNPGEEYENTRHNIGRMVLSYVNKKNGDDSWKADKILKALVSKIKVENHTVILLMPETFMNNSGKSLATLVSTPKDALRTIVIYDDLDLPLGTLKISFNRSSGGHKGVESIRKVVKTDEFVRIRIGISNRTPTGKLRKPKGEDAVQTFILGKFKKNEEVVLKKVIKEAHDALITIIEKGYVQAMNEFNQK